MVDAWRTGKTAERPTIFDQHNTRCLGTANLLRTNMRARKGRREGVRKEGWVEVVAVRIANVVTYSK